MRVADKRNIGQVFQRLLPATRVHLARGCVAPENLGDLQVEEVGRVECLAGSGQSIADARSGWRVEEDL